MDIQQDTIEAIKYCVYVGKIYPPENRLSTRYSFDINNIMVCDINFIKRLYGDDVYYKVYGLESQVGYEKRFSAKLVKHSDVISAIRLLKLIDLTESNTTL